MTFELQGLRQLRQREDAATSVEYGLIVSLIAGMIIIAVFAFGSMTSGAFSGTCDSVESAPPVTATCQ